VLSLSCAQSHAHIGGIVLAHNLEPFVELIAGLLERPAFRATDVALCKRETIAQLHALTDDDGSLVRRHFRSFALGRHPYARPASGTVASVGALTRADVLAQHERLVCGANLVISAWGDFRPAALGDLFERAFGGLPRGRSRTPKLAHPTPPRGRRLLIIDKPERAQTQIAIATLGTHPRDPEHVPLWVGNTAFGGLFTSRLTTEVRGKRGWSYGASSTLTQSRTRDVWSMWTAPAATDARACIELQLSLLERWVERGVTRAELHKAKQYLVKSHAFDLDTAQKRLDQDLDDEVFDYPRGFHRRFIERVKHIDRAKIATALRRRIHPEDLAIVVVATATELGPDLAKLPGLSSVEIVPFDRV
jgi:zinc protease